MNRLLKLLLLGVLVATLPGSSAEAAECGGLGSATVRVVVREPPASLQSNFDLFALNAAASRGPLVAKHPVLGFYGMTVGYTRPDVIVAAVSASRTERQPCPAVLVDAEIVVTDRRIEIARDLKPCQVPAVFAHYQRHAAAASLAFNRFAAELSPRLEEQLNLSLRAHPPSPRADHAELQEHVGELLDQAIGAFMASVPSLQQEVDTPAEIRALNEPCSSI